MTDDSAWFTEAIREIFGYGAQTHLARFLALTGDKRTHATILRSISNYASGRSPLLPEMRALLMVLRQSIEVSRMIAQAKSQKKDLG